MDVNRTIDINCDLGEGLPNDAKLMPYISSCNIACGGHFGTTESMKTAIQLAKKHKVKIGAHPSYPDKENFGRKLMEISDDALIKSISTQLNDFLSVCENQGVEVNHVKLHGALYNASMHDLSLSKLVSRILSSKQLSVPIYAPQNSALSKLVEFSVHEAFIDRRYNEDGTLVSRSQSNALIIDPNEAWNQLKQMYFDQNVTSIHGTAVPISAETYCLHGDSENALDMAKFIHSKLNSMNIQLAKNE